MSVWAAACIAAKALLLNHSSARLQSVDANAKSGPGWIAKELPCGHDAMIDMPDELTEILEAA
jgi:hypothetical protein